MKGGFEVKIGSNRAFCPFSQMSLRRVSDSSVYIGKKLKFMITEYAEGGRNLIVSHRAILEEELQQEKELLKDSLHVGMIMNATVTSIQKFGAFVRAGAIEGLLPVSEIGWKRVKDVADVLSVGDEISVVLKSIDWENDKFSFSLKDTLPDPWEAMLESLPVGSVHTGTVTRLAQFGAFVTIADGVDGLLHISKIGKGKRISHPREVLKEGEVVEVIIEGIDRENKRISLAIAETEASWELLQETIALTLQGRAALPEEAPAAEALPELERARAHVVEEGAVVRDHQHRARVIDEELLQPVDRPEIEVVGGLVQQQQLGSLREHHAQVQVGARIKRIRFQAVFIRLFSLR